MRLSRIWRILQTEDFVDNTLRDYTCEFSQSEMEKSLICKILSLSLICKLIIELRKVFCFVLSFFNLNQLSVNFKKIHYMTISFFPQKANIEDITWACRDTIFLFKCWKYFTSERSEQVKYFFNTIYYINTNEIPNHFTLIVFWCERCDLLCNHSKGDIFTLWR